MPLVLPTIGKCALTHHSRQCDLDLRGAPVDVSGVRTKILGTVLSASWALIALVGWASTATAAPTSTDAPQVVVMGDNTYSVTCVAKNGFHRDIEALKAQANILCVYKLEQLSKGSNC